jgi:hypothetical protein
MSMANLASKGKNSLANATAVASNTYYLIVWEYNVTNKLNITFNKKPNIRIRKEKKKDKDFIGTRMARAFVFVFTECSLKLLNQWIRIKHKQDIKVIS